MTVAPGNMAGFAKNKSAREAAWRAEAEAAMETFGRRQGGVRRPTHSWRPKGEFERDGEKGFQLSEQFLVLITCRHEEQQVELLSRFHGERLECKALVG